MKSERPRASLQTIGCRLNQAETALLADRLKQDGYDLVAPGQPTDLLVLNTCSVTDHAESDCRYLVRRTLHQSPHAFVAVTGCYAQTGAEALSRMPGIDLIVGTQFKMELPNLLPPPHALRKQPAPHLSHTRTLDRDDFVLPGTGDYDSKRANLKIQDGCDFMCSFCL
ncbi:MAG: tRNA (N(6)-L-threonylcarbamoyladenosine(37)-C(2))-methylthiotransferase MtaB, partial [Nitrospirae bacterium]|nr:tRNA (N(6)-L-threonylcarbamoyladenosine(37)-C(2))-methylthiotransferase MtaB [Nitrospirota bacterium]